MYKYTYLLTLLSSNDHSRLLKTQAHVFSIVIVLIKIWIFALIWQ